MSHGVRALLFLLLSCLASGQLHAQTDQEMRIEDFVTRVARHWAAADVGAIVDLIPADGTILLDTGEGTASANSLHAAAALRALFADHETLGARPLRITVTSMNPQTGFSELAWSYRTRGAPDEQVRPLYLAMVAEAGVWKITELRLMP